MDQSKVGVVAARIRRLIDDGSLRFDDRLPSTRRLAIELGVSRGTVVTAYEQLDGEGYIRTGHGALARVAAHLPAAVDRSAMESRSSVLPADAPSGLLDLRPGIPDVMAMSGRDRRAAWSAAASAPLRNALAHPFGVSDLREQVSAQLGLVRGFSPAAERVLVCGGTSDAISLITEALTGLRRRPPAIAVEDPGYPSARSAIRSAGGRLIPMRVDDAGLDPDRLPDHVDAILVTPAHQYPLGSVMPIDRRRRLLARAAAIGAVVIEDDYDSEFRHRGIPLPALAALDTDGLVIHLGTFSKNLDPGLRCSYVVTPPTGLVRDALRSTRRARGPVVADTVQLAIAHLIRSGALRRHIGRLRRDYTHKRTLITARLPELDTHGIRAHALSAGLHVVLTWQRAPASADIVRRVAEDGIQVADLASYRVTPDDEQQGIVLGYGAATGRQLDQAISALIRALHTAPRPARAEPLEAPSWQDPDSAGLQERR